MNLPKIKIVIPKLTINIKKLKKGNFLIALAVIIIAGGLNVYKYRSHFLKKEKPIVTNTIPEEKTETITKFSKRAGIVTSIDTEVAIARLKKIKNIPFSVAKKMVEAENKAGKLYNYAIKNMDKGNYEEAVRSFNEILEITDVKSPYFYNSNLKLGEIYDILDNPVLSAKYYLQMLKYPIPENRIDSYKIYHNLGVIFAEASLFDTSLYYYDMALQNNDKLVESYIGKANVYLHTRKIADAMDILENALGIVDISDDPEINYNIALLSYKYLKNNVNYQQLINRFKKALKSKNKKIKELSGYYLAKIYQETGDYEKSVNSLRTAIECNPDKAAYYFLRGNLYYALENGEAMSSDSYKKAVKLQPHNPLYLVKVGNIYFNEADYEMANDYYFRALDIDNKTLAAYYGLGKSMYKLGYIKDALKNFTTVIRLKDDPDIPDNKTYINAMLKDLYKYMGIILDEKMNQYEEARECYLNAIKLEDNTDNISVLNYNVGLLFLKTDQHENALNYFLKALRTQPDNYYYNKSVAVEYYGFEKYADAIDYIKKALELKPNDSELNFMLGYSYYMRGEMKRADEEFTRTVEIAAIAHRADILNSAYKNKGNIYYFMALNNKKKEMMEEFNMDIETAIMNFKKAINHNELDDESYYNIALCYFQKGEYNNSIFYSKAAIKINSSNSNYYTTLGNCYFEKGLNNNAKNSFTTALKLDPSNIEAQYNLRILE